MCVIYHFCCVVGWQIPTDTVDGLWWIERRARGGGGLLLMCRLGTHAIRRANRNQNIASNCYYNISWRVARCADLLCLPVQWQNQMRWCMIWHVISWCDFLGPVRPIIIRCSFFLCSRCWQNYKLASSGQHTNKTKIKRLMRLFSRASYTYKGHTQFNEYFF